VRTVLEDCFALVHVPRIVVEAAWAYRHRPAVGRTLAASVTLMQSVVRLPCQFDHGCAD